MKKNFKMSGYRIALTLLILIISQISVFAAENADSNTTSTFSVTGILAVVGLILVLVAPAFKGATKYKG